MSNATRLMASTFGTVAAIAGLEHGFGEILQGNIAPTGLMFESWADTPAFEILAGEPAMSLIPNLLISGILSVILSMILLIWAIRFIERKHAGLVLILISVVLLLVGGGFGPPLLGIVVGLAATRIHAPLTWWRRHLSTGLRRSLGRLWRPAYILAIIAWLCVLPGMLFLGGTPLADSLTLVPAVTLTAFGMLLLTILTGYARDSQERMERLS